MIEHALETVPRCSSGRPYSPARQAADTLFGSRGSGLDCQRAGGWEVNLDLEHQLEDFMVWLGP